MLMRVKTDRNVALPAQMINLPTGDPFRRILPAADKSSVIETCKSP